MGSLMRRAFFHRGDTGMKVVEAFDGLILCHGGRKAKEGGGGTGTVVGRGGLAAPTRPLRARCGWSAA
jgi:hypothetical protein